MTTDTVEKTLEAHLRERLLGETKPNLLPDEKEMLREFMIAEIFSTVDSSEKKRYLENFTISNIHPSVEEIELIEHIQDHYRMQGYDANEDLMRICFRKERQKVGINLSYIQDYQTCLIVVLDLS